MYTKGKSDVAAALNSIKTTTAKACNSSLPFELVHALPALKGVTVTASYNTAMKSIPSILYSEVVNIPLNKGKEKRTQLAYSIDIYAETSTTELTGEVDRVMTLLGMRRGQCIDLDDPSGLRHKNMKYSAVYDENTNKYYHE